MTHQENILARIRGIHDTRKLGLNHSPFGTDKLLYKSYLEHLYPELLTRLPQIKSIVEIGVRGGASLYLWSQLFPESRVTGVDMVDIGQESGPNPAFMAQNNIVFIKGDAYTNEVADKILAEVDLLIDDGSHYLKDQIKLAELYPDKLSKNGILVIEDIQRGYRDAYKIMRRLRRDRFSIRVYDFRYNKNVYDDFVICISRGKTSACYQIYLGLRSKIYVIEHGLVKISKLLSLHWKGRGGRNLTQE